MKEELQKEGLSIIKEEIAEIKSSLKERMKLPILVAYCIILVIYNWDVLFYFVLESGIPSQKIAYINKNFANDYHHRFLIPLLLSFLSTFAFPVLQVGINLLFKEFKNENDQLIKEKEKADIEHEKALIDIKSNNKKIKVLQDDLNNKNDEILILKSQITQLEKSNLDLVEEEKDARILLKGEYSYSKSLNQKIEDLKEIFHIYSNKDFVSTKLNYQIFFNKFYSYYINSLPKERDFIKKLLNKFQYSTGNTLDSSKIDKIDVSELVDTYSIIDNLVNLEIFKSNTPDLVLTNKGIEVVSLFKKIYDLE